MENILNCLQFMTVKMAPQIFVIFYVLEHQLDSYWVHFACILRIILEAISSSCFPIQPIYPINVIRSRKKGKKKHCTHAIGASPSQLCVREERDPGARRGKFPVMRQVREATVKGGIGFMTGESESTRIFTRFWMLF